MPKLVVILGPTGVGKTDFSLQLAEQWSCPIVSADSRQIYRDLPIGTAAPTPEEMARVPHYFIGCKDLFETYSAGQYARDCTALLADLFEQHEQVIMVGGSMMYIDAVCKGIDAIPDVPEQVRTFVREQYTHLGLQWLQSEVMRLDPVYWSEVDQHNPQRLMHCLEVCLATGSPFSTFRKGAFRSITSQQRGFEVEYRMIERPRQELYDRINLRVHKMIEAGLVQEAQRAFDILGVSTLPHIDEPLLPNSVNTVGYKELLKYFRAEWSLEKAIEMIQQNSRHYAKRQMTWWRRDAALCENQ